MIRITFLNKQLKQTFEREFEMFYKDKTNNDYVGITNVGITRNVYHCSDVDIIKIEKQVKDLTIEECKTLRLCLEMYSTEVRKAHTTDYDYDRYTFDDYIDVTALYKEVE